MFCLGQHILIDTAQCVAKGAGGATRLPELAPAYTPIVGQAAAPAQALGPRRGPAQEVGFCTLSARPVAWSGGSV